MNPIWPIDYQKLYRMLLDCVPCSVLMIGSDGRVVEANKNFLNRSRRGIADTLGHRLEKVFPASILESVPINRQIDHVLSTGEPTQGQQMTYRAPGVPLRVYYYRIFPIINKETKIAMLLMDDITEQVRLSKEVRRVERHLADVFESASDMILSIDVEGRIVSWNPALENCTGYAAHEVAGKSFHLFLSDEGKNEWESILYSLKRGATKRMSEGKVISKDGGWVYASWVFSPLLDQETGHTGAVAVGRDLTDRRMIEVQLLQSQKFAALGVMAGGIAHEIRNPLAICSSAAQFLMGDDVDDAFRKECALKIQKGLERAASIIENLLRFAKPAERAERLPIDLSLLVRETQNLILNQARIQKIELAQHCPEHPVMVNGNQSLLQQVLINLYLNAIESMPDGGVLRTEVGLHQEEAMIDVSDTGVGIPSESISRIFDPFFTTASVGKGTGLGLSLSYSIVEQHGGIIEVKSKVGEGSRFRIRLPLVDVENPGRI